MTKTTSLGFTLNAYNVDPNSPLLYRIWVKAAGRDETTIYVGQSRNGAARPFQRYDLNVRRLMDGKSPMNGAGYRPVHYDLKAAHRAGRQIGIDLVRNVDLSIERIIDAERQLQNAFGIAPADRSGRRLLDDDGKPAVNSARAY